MDKTKGELLQEELLFKQENGTTRLSDEEIDKAYAFAEDYKKFMDAAKIEIEAVKEAIKLLEANGYHEFERGRKYLPGERFYYNNRGKSLIFGTVRGFRDQLPEDPLLRRHQEISVADHSVGTARRCLQERRFCCYHHHR